MRSHSWCTKIRICAITHYSAWPKLPAPKYPTLYNISRTRVIFPPITIDAGLCGMVPSTRRESKIMNLINAADTDTENSGWLNKREIAARYGISERQVDYLREKTVLPFYELPSRCIRFDPHE